MPAAAPPATAARTAVIRLTVRRLEDGKYYARSPDVPGLNVVAGTFVETVDLARQLTAEFAEFLRDTGQELPPALRGADVGELPEVEVSVAVEVAGG